MRLGRGLRPQGAGATLPSHEPVRLPARVSPAHHPAIRIGQNGLAMLIHAARRPSPAQQAAKICFAFKILAAGCIGDEGVTQAFRTAFDTIKLNDGIYVGMFPRRKDEVKEKVEIVHGILNGGKL